MTLRLVLQRRLIYLWRLIGVYVDLDDPGGTSLYVLLEEVFDKFVFVGDCLR